MSDRLPRPRPGQTLDSGIALPKTGDTVRRRAISAVGRAARGNERAGSERVRERRETSESGKAGSSEATVGRSPGSDQRDVLRAVLTAVVTRMRKHTRAVLRANGFGDRSLAARPRIGWAASIAFCGVLPALTVIALFATAITYDVVALDFRAFVRGADAIVRGQTPYVGVEDPAAVVNESYVYPPLAAIGVIPFTALSQDVAGLLAMGMLVVAVLLIPFVLGVRDWRCYGVVLIWPPVITAIQTGSVTILLALGAALAWRFREQLTSPVSVGAALALKLFLWPLVVWLLATRRPTAALLSFLIGAGLALGSWAAIGFVGLAAYPDLLRRLQDLIELHCYTLYAVAIDLGASPVVARSVWLAGGLAVLGAVVVAARRGDSRSSFILALAAALALSPIVWLHYFTLLLVAVAIVAPRLSPIWFVPLAMVVATGNGDPTLLQTGAVLAASAVTVALAIVPRESFPWMVDRGRRPAMLGRAATEPNLTTP